MKNQQNDEIIDIIKKDALDNNVPILQDKALDFILFLLNIVKPQRILEVGTAVGYSAINFAKYLQGENSKILSIEIKKEMYDKALENINAAKLGNKIEVIFADATKYLEQVNENDGLFDIIFIDAAKGQYMVFLEHALRLVRPGGIIVADNVLFKGRVLSDYNDHKYRTAVNRLREYLKFIQEDSRLNSKIFDIGDGIAVSIKK
ncbi:MAG: O-methyltransferase [Clostridia bacterium]|nr:O-methyltransferase [Clostridia bacterium]